MKSELLGGRYAVVEVDHDDVPVVDENDVRVEVSGDVGGVVEVVDMVSYWWIPLCWQWLRSCVLRAEVCSGGPECGGRSSCRDGENDRGCVWANGENVHRKYLPADPHLR